MTKGFSILQSVGLINYLPLFAIGISFRGGRRNKRFKKPEPKRLHKINQEIKAEEVRLIGDEGEEFGIVPLDKALSMAQERQVDLVEISPKAKPPVCKLVEYGKMLYQMQKKDKANKAASKKNEIKGIRLTFRIGDGDLDRQRKHSEEFLKTGHPVRIQMVMRGRERAHADLAIEKLNAFIDSLEEFGTVDQKPKLGGFQIIALMKPKK